MIARRCALAALLACWCAALVPAAPAAAQNARWGIFVIVFTSSRDPI